MAQASENVNVSQNLGKMFSAQKNGYIFAKVFLAKPFFSKVFDQKKKATPYVFTTNPFATNSNKIKLLLQAPAERAPRSSELTRSVFGEIRFSQKSLTNRKKQPLTISRQVLVQQTQEYPAVTTRPAERPTRSAQLLRSCGIGK